jgi:hypothetical protein
MERRLDDREIQDKTGFCLLSARPELGKIKEPTPPIDMWHLR